MRTRALETIVFEKYAHLENATHLSGFLECQEVLVSSEIRTGSFETESAPFRQDTVIEVNGNAHREHRRLASRLFAKSSLAFYEQNLLEPAIRTRLIELAGTRDPIGGVRADLGRIVRRMMVTVAANIIGLDGVDSNENCDALLAHGDLLGAGADVKWSHKDHATVVAEGIDAKQRFVDDFYAGSAARRQAMVARVRAGHAAQSELPSDLITLMLLEDPAVWDEALRLREATFYLMAGIRTTASAVTHTVDELAAWVASHPEDKRQLDNIDFLRASCNEAIRLHPPAPVLVREAISDFTLVTGRRIKSGQRIGIDLVMANRDDTIFGPDAQQFNPHRVLSARFPPFGLSFGAGPHLCIGKPLVTTTGTVKMADGYEVQRAIVRILKGLYEFGVEPDPDGEPERGATAQDRFDSYPVIFTGL